jgi:hypothetical protein
LSKVLANGPVKAKDIEKEARAACLLSEDQLIGQSKPFRSARQALAISSYQSTEKICASLATEIRAHPLDMLVTPATQRRIVLFRMLHQREPPFVVNGITVTV